MPWIETLVGLGHPEQFVPRASALELGQRVLVVSQDLFLCGDRVQVALQAFPMVAERVFQLIST